MSDLLIQELLITSRKRYSSGDDEENTMESHPLNDAFIFVRYEGAM